jgi:pimeloyl-ACP methyl ester carboxylesterase
VIYEGELGIVVGREGRNIRVEDAKRLERARGLGTLAGAQGFAERLLFRLPALVNRLGRPEVDPFNFAPRVTIPTLMLNGRYDSIYPVEECQLPLFRLLGTEPEHKRHMIYDTAHAVPQNESIKETLNWLDRYLGPVESQESAAVSPP